MFFAIYMQKNIIKNKEGICFSGEITGQTNTDVKSFRNSGNT